MILHHEIAIVNEARTILQLALVYHKHCRIKYRLVIYVVQSMKNRCIGVATTKVIS